MTDTEPVQDVEEKEIPSYADHMLKCEVFADELTEILRSRGFHHCEVAIFCNWQGLVIMSKNTITNGMGPQGPIIITCNCPMPLSWTLPVEKRETVEESLNNALCSIDRGIVAQCAKQKVLALSYNSFVSKMSTTIATANAVPTLNGKSRILRA